MLVYVAYEKGIQELTECFANNFDGKYNLLCF